MNKREGVSWVVALIGGIVAIMASAGAYHIYMMNAHEPRGSTSAGLGAVFLFLKSQNQNIRNYYEGIPDEERTPSEQKRLDGLEYEEKYIDLMQENLGVRPKDE